MHAYSTARNRPQRLNHSSDSTFHTKGIMFVCSFYKSPKPVSQELIRACVLARESAGRFASVVVAAHVMSLDGAGTQFIE